MDKTPFNRAGSCSSSSSETALDFFTPSTHPRSCEGEISPLNLVDTASSGTPNVAFAGTQDCLADQELCLSLLPKLEICKAATSTYPGDLSLPPLFPKCQAQKSDLSEHRKTIFSSRVAEIHAVRDAQTVTSELLSGRADAKKRHGRSVSRVPPGLALHEDRLAVTSGTDKVSDEYRSGTIDSEGEAEEEQVKPKKLSQRKLVDKLAFDSHMQKLAKRLNEATTKTNTIDNLESLKNPTTKWLSKVGAENIISSPREYQIELFELAKQKNVIAVLDTGSGKTLIAVLLLNHIFDEELEARALGKLKRISFFLVNSVTLAAQQFAFLECNISQPMDILTGSAGCELWSKALWDAQYEKNMAIVCTADVLYHCLHHGFLTMSQINILIFDEAHHAKKGNTYARIIKDFYAAETTLSKRPKIFGMTASPVDSRTDVESAAAQLESLLHSQIVTASDPKLMQYAPTAKREEVAMYHALGPRYKTPLYLTIEAAIGEIALHKELTFAMRASCELGAWCSDNIWSMCLSEEQCRKLEAKVERQFYSKNVAQPISVLDERKASIRTAQRAVTAHDFMQPQPTLNHLSSKVLELMRFLRSRYERKTNDKCIVFVNQRYSAVMLTELFRCPNVGTPYLKPGFLIGQQADDAGKGNINIRAQMLTLVSFRRGDLNCLFATSVAEEGLDIPDCNLVVRFDLYTTLIQYIQSRGRARLPNSQYIHMLEQGNREHSALLKEVFDGEKVLRKFCQGLDGDRLLTGNSYDMDFFLAKEKKHRIYVAPDTGSKLTYRLSIMVLENFANSLPNAEDGTQNATYVMTRQGSEFTCEVILPPNSPISGAVGNSASTKQVAKCSAAFEACLALRKGGHLDGHFISTHQKQAPLMRNARLAVNSKKQTLLQMRVKPEIWSMNTVPQALFLTIMTISNPEHLKRPSQPLGLLTRTRLPPLPEFPLFFGAGRRSFVNIQTLTLAMPLCEETLRLVNNFTLRIFNDVFSKQYEPDLAKMPYFLVPVLKESALEDSTLPNDAIDWQVLELVRDGGVTEIPMDPDAPADWFADRFIVDIFDGSRKFYTIGQAHHLTPLDPLPKDMAPRSGTRRNNDNIMEYSISLWANSRAKRTFQDDQPVIQAELLGLRRNLLDDNDQDETISQKNCYIILEPLRISILPTTVVAMALVFPAILHRLESYLIAVEACEKLGLQVRADLALEAFTKDSDNTEEHSQEQIQFQRGMGRNYERLEFLGDCFLKMAVSIALYGRHPEGNEQDYHVGRMLLICNQNLLNVAIKLKTYEYIRSQGFNRRAWYPEGLAQRRGKNVAAPTAHKLNDKTIADVSEALIGACLLSEGFDTAVKAVKILVDSEDHPMDCYADYYKSYKIPKYQIADCTASQRDMAAQIYRKHPYRFNHPRILRSAFTHPSYPFSYEKIPNYQRLEFLGDAMFDMAAINYLYHAYPTRDPQWLTEHKMAMVSNQFLGALCVHLGLHRYLQVLSPVIYTSILEYVEEVKLVRQCAQNDAIRAGKTAADCLPDWWTSTKSPPKCLPDVVEAFIGAIFVDSEYNYSEVERFFDMHVKSFFKDMQIYDTFANKHPVTFLNNFLELHMGCRRFAVNAQEVPDVGDGMPPNIVAVVLIHGKVVCDKEGSSARYAKVAVAKNAMETLAGLGRPEFRAQYGCDCRTEIVDGEEVIVDGDGDVIGAEDVDHGTAI